MESTNQKQNKKQGIIPLHIEQELKESFLDYAMSVVVSRALPDIRDGLKPVHRRILYTMYSLGFFHNKSYHKSVRVVGEVLGKFHPHGDQSVYQSMVGLVQDFVKRYPLLDGQGNWGSVDGDNAAAMRYTEIRMHKIAQELLFDIEKNTVPFTPNFDESTEEPVVLPSRLPNLLINGTAGIAVGMATSIPPHNLKEVVNACLSALENKDLTEDEIIELIPAPDFPTGGIICGRGGIVKAYKTGRGNLILRAVVEVEEEKNNQRLVVTQLPYQVNKSDLIIKIADLVKEKVIDGISNIRDESNKKGIRLVIELKRGEIPQVILNQLFKHTALQTSVSILMLGLLDNQPIVFTLKQLILEFLHHREQIVYRRTEFELQKARDRDHLLDGFIIALSHIDDIVALIKRSESAQAAIVSLHTQFNLSETQSKAILDMRLQRLTGMEQAKIHQEKEAIIKTISFLKSILENPETLKKEIRTELEGIRDSYADERKTKIEGAIDILTEIDLIEDEEVVVTLTVKGYVKRVPLSVYGTQHRGGKGKMGMASLEDDIVQHMFVTRNHDTILFFTNLGRVYSMQVFELPEGSRISKGRAIINMLPLQENEKVVKMLPTRDLEGQFLVMITKNGIIKKTDAGDFSKIRQTGIRALTLKENDELAFCSLSSGTDTILIATANGMGIRFSEDEVRSMGRQAAGVIGIRMRKKDSVVGFEVIPSAEGAILFATERGYGKKVDISDFRIAHRGGLGVRTIPTDTRNGKVIGLAIVTEHSDVMLIDQAGKIIRMPTSEIREMGRQAKGVRLIRLDEDQILANIVAFEHIPNNDDSEEDQNNGNNAESKTGITQAI
jgi:DNA gyrase subunit A